MYQSFSSSTKVISKVSYPHGLSFRPYSLLIFVSLMILKLGCNFYLFATEQVYMFWLQKSK